MKLRMYLRGLGLGMILTALVLSFGMKSDKKTMSDAEIRAKAKELGMVDDSATLKDTSAEEVKEEPAEKAPVEEKAPAAEESESIPEKKAEEAETVQEAVEETEAEESEAEKKKAEEAEKKKAEEEAAKKAAEEAEKKKAEEEAAKKAAEEAEKKKAEEEAVKKAAKEAEKKTSKGYSLRIEKGYSSDKVARILEDAGVVGSAASFDKYLCSNGYDHRISVGTYQIPAGADYAAIAKLITHSK